MPDASGDDRGLGLVRLKRQGDGSPGATASPCGRGAIRSVVASVVCHVAAFRVAQYAEPAR